MTEHDRQIENAYHKKKQVLWNGQVVKLLMIGGRPDGTHYAIANILPGFQNQIPLSEFELIPG